jgi:hypothetical protein
MKLLYGILALVFATFLPVKAQDGFQTRLCVFGEEAGIIILIRQNADSLESEIMGAIEKGIMKNGGKEFKGGKTFYQDFDITVEDNNFNGDIIKDYRVRVVKHPSGPDLLVSTPAGSKSTTVNDMAEQVIAYLKTFNNVVH